MVVIAVFYIPQIVLGFNLNFVQNHDVTFFERTGGAKPLLNALIKSKENGNYKISLGDKKGERKIKRVYACSQKKESMHNDKEGRHLDLNMCNNKVNSVLKLALHLDKSDHFCPSKYSSTAV